MEVTIKAYLMKEDATVEVRRISLLSPNFETVMAKMATAFADLDNKDFTLMWKDADDDFVIMSSDEELQDALTNTMDSTLKVYINVDGDKVEEAIPSTIDMENDSGEAQAEEQRANHEREVPLQDFPNDIPAPPPPPPFGFGPCKKFMHHGHGNRHFPFLAPFAFKHHKGMRGFHGHHGPVGHHGRFGRHHGPFDGHQGPLGGHHGPFGGHHGPFDGPHGKNGPFGGHHGSFDGPHGKNGPFGGHHGPFGGRHGPFDGQHGEDGPFGGHHGPFGGHHGPFDGPHGQDGPFSGHHGPFGGHHGQDGPFGGHHGPFGGHHGQDGPFGGHHGPLGGHHGPFGGHHGPLGGHHGPLGGHHGPFGGHHGPFGGPMRRHHRHGGPFGMGRHGHHKWIGELREKVPESHRIWAKRYIGLWRLQNLKNASTTTSDSDNFDPEDKVTREAAGVPDAYVVWLNVILPKWHRRWGETDTDMSDTDEKLKKQGKDQKKALKTSVPKEFRKWSKWHLARHYGPREAPKLRDDGKQAKCAGREFTKAYKMHSLTSQVNVKQRRWAKQFILKWRTENKMGELSPDTSSASESNDAQSGSLTAEQAGVHEDYGRWLNKFLPRWHMWRGLMEKGDKPVEKGGMEEFKDTVPMTFRRWVKFYLANKYLKRAERAEKTYSAEQYRKWVKAFQKQWLLMKSVENSDDVLVLTSDDEYAQGSSEAETGETEKSFKHLRLDDKDKESSEEQKKRVQFSPSTEKWQKVMITDESDGDEDETMVPERRCQRKAPINPEFRRWAMRELSEWDGQHVPQNEGADASEGADAEVETIPPHIYNWMTKVTMKMEKKKMKEDFKLAKKQMKAALKAQKRE